MNKEKPQKTKRRTKFVEDKYLMDWIGENMPPSKEGFTATDLDLILRDKSGKIMLLETKRMAAGVKAHQSITFAILDAALKRLDGETIKVRPKSLKYPVSVKVNYQGFHLLQFEKTTFENGRVLFDDKFSTEAKIRSILSMKKNRK